MATLDNVHSPHAVHNEATPGPVVAPPRNDALKSVTAPALVIHGADDPLVPVEAGQDTADSIPGAELIIVPGMGHDVTVALTPVLLTHVGDFVARVDKRAV